jgi:hypothetical protein
LGLADVIPKRKLDKQVSNEKGFHDVLHLHHILATAPEGKFGSGGTIVWIVLGLEGHSRYVMHNTHGAEK